jgi:hypothetical protein
MDSFYAQEFVVRFLFPAITAFPAFLRLLQQLGRGRLIDDQFVHEPAF